MTSRANSQRCQLSICPKWWGRRGLLDWKHHGIQMQLARKYMSWEASLQLAARSILGLLFAWLFMHIFCGPLKVNTASTQRTFAESYQVHRTSGETVDLRHLTTNAVCREKLSTSVTSLRRQKLSAQRWRPRTALKKNTRINSCYGANERVSFNAAPNT